MSLIIRKVAFSYAKIFHMDVQNLAALAGIGSFFLGLLTLLAFRRNHSKRGSKRIGILAEKSSIELTSSRMKNMDIGIKANESKVKLKDTEMQ